MKAKIEWKDGDLWRQVDVELGFSRNNNYWFKHNGTVYVFPALKDGTKVLAKIGDKWIEAGRVTRHVIFLGEGLSFSEFNEQRFLNEKWVAPVMP